METIAGWIAPAATMVAAIVTAANLGTRVTGWGFVVFTLGEIGWCIEARPTQRPNLLCSNPFLGAIDAVAIYRCLVQRTRHGALAAVEKSRGRTAPLFAILSMEGRKVEAIQ